MTQRGTFAYIGLGSNLADPEWQVRLGLEALDALRDSFLVRASRLFRSDPIGPVGQPRYVNAAAQLQTTLPADVLLDELHEIEHRQGRVRVTRWGPRTLDLDLLLYGEKVSSGPSPILPHPRLHERAFVLMPLLDLDSSLEIPVLGRAATLLAALDTRGVNPIRCE
jgi:2-amino-4-hydroxy-6-hydroxymethyldihydropteridine diphosphokinase